MTWLAIANQRVILLRSVTYISLYQTEAKLRACDISRLCGQCFLNLVFVEKQLKNAPSAFAVLSHWVESEKDKSPTQQSHFFLPGDSQFFGDWQAWNHQACATCPVYNNITQCLLHMLWSQTIWLWEFHYVKSSLAGMGQKDNF